MANLETLEMTINANAQSASKGLGKLIGSLSILSAKVSSAASSMKQLNSELKSLQNFKNVKLPGMLGGAYDSSHTTGAQRTVRNIKQVNSALQEHINTVTGINRVSKNAKNSAMWMDRLLSGQEFASRTVAAASSSKAFKAVPSVMKEYQKEDISQWQSWRYGPNKPRVFNNNGYTPEQLAESNRKAEEDRARYYRELAEVRASMKSGGENATWAEDNIKATASFNKLAENLYGTKKTANSAKTAVKQVAEVATKAVEKTRTAMEDVVGKRNQSTDKGSFFERMKEGFNNMTSGFSRFVSRIGRIASTMLMRKALKALVAAAKEGTENLYQYSKGLGGEFASSMDRMASSMAQLKNAAGTAIAPALSAIIPVLNAISSAAITAFNALSQLFALLGGKGTWTKATAVVNEYAEATEKAGGGGGGLKEMLADFDELNVIASESGGGGGGGGSGIDYADMFEEVSVFSQEIKDIVEWIQTHMDSILGMALAIGTAILGWKVSEAFTGLLSTLGGLIAGGAVIAVTCQAVWLMDNQYFKDKNPGWLIGDMLVSAVGATLAGKIVGSVLGGSAGLITAAITLELSALTTIIALLKNTDVSALSTEGILASVVAALKAGAGIAILQTAAGAGLTNAVITGVSGALIVLGVTVGLKTLLDPNIDTLSLDHIKAAVLSALAIGAGTGVFLWSVLGNADPALISSMAGGVALITLGAVIGLKAVLDPDVSALSSTHIVAALLAGLATGAGTFVIMNGLNYSRAQALTAAGGVALITIGVVIGLKAIFDENVANLSIEHITSAVLSALTIGGGVFLLAKGGFFGMAQETALASGGAAALITLGVVIGLKAVFSKDVENLDAEHIKSAVLSGLSVGAGIYILAKSGIFSGIQNAALAGTGAALITLGVVIGLKVIPTYDKEGLSAGVVKSGLLSALGIGVGAGMIASAMGAAAGVAGVVGLIAGGAVILTLGAIIAVKALLSVDKKDMGITLTEEEVQDFVNTKMFKVDVNATVKAINLTLENIGAAQQSLKTQVTSLLSNLNVLKLGIDKTNTLASIKATLGDKDTAGTLMHDINSLCDANVDLLKLTFANVKAVDSSGKDITSETLLAGIQGWSDVKKEMEAAGAELTKLMFAAAERELTPSEEQYTQELLEKIAKITSAITTSQIAGDAYTKLQLSLSDLSNKSVKEVAKEFEEYKKTLETSLRSAVQKVIGQYNQLAEFYAITGKPELAQKYRELAKDLAEGMEQSIAQSLEEATEPGKQLIRDYIKKVFADLNDDDFKLDLSRYVNSEGGWQTILEKKGFTSDGLKEAIRFALEGAGVDPEVLDLAETVGITGWELLTEDMKKEIVRSCIASVDGVNAMKGFLKLSVGDIIDTIGWESLVDEERTNLVWKLLDAYGSEETLGYLKNQLKISINDLVTIVGWDNLEEWQRAGLVNGLVAAYGSAETIAILKDRCKMSAADIVGITNWAAFTSQQQLEFTAALSNAFGAETALNAAKNAGVNILKLVAQGMNSDNEAIRKAAMEWKGIIESIVPHIGVELSYHINISSNGKVESVRGTVTDSGGINAGGAIRNPGSGKNLSIAMDAGGAYDISRGDLFIANEAGAELVGSINGKTSVANQGQIIEGIQKGVRDANAEQNALLRQQNDLLRSILEKDNSVRIGASAALGRIVNQSTAMYNKAAGLGGV